MKVYRVSLDAIVKLFNCDSKHKNPFHCKNGLLTSESPQSPQYRKPNTLGRPLTLK